jgi:phosphate transport system substrate-binding protein
MNFSVKIFASLFFLVTIYSCGDTKRDILTDTPTSGTINVAVDETYRPIMDSEQMVFQSHYPDAHINLIYMPALEVLKQADNDSIRVMITANEVDSSYFKSFYEKKKYFPRGVILAKDAVAIIANNSKSGMQITLAELAKICRGEITDFSQLAVKKGSGKITLVFDNAQSSTVQYIQESVMKSGTITSKAFAQKTNEEVLSYVTKNPNAIGIIGVNWISDNQDIETLKFSKDIFPVEIRDADSSQYYYPPHPGYIASHLYPMRRHMTATIKENGAALGRGFINFMGGEIGQRVVLKAGLVPAKVPTRVIETKPSM